MTESSSGVRADLAPLFEPLRIRGTELANRVLMSPMTQMTSPGARPGETVLEHYRSRAAGGTGLVVTEGIGIDHPASVDHSAIPRLDGPGAMDAWRVVVDAVHAAGAPIVAQLWHVGPLWGANAMWDPEHRAALDAVRPMRPSGLWGHKGVTTYPDDEVARWLEPIDPMSDREISDCLDAYAHSAALAVEAGFDGVEIHGGHGYLPDAFVWSETNRRTDRWGGDLAARAGFAAEAVRRVRAAIGGDRPLFYRFSQHTQQDYTALKARTPDELGVYLGALVAAGADVLDASARRFDAPAFPDLPGTDGELSLAGWAKRLTGAFAVGVGGVGVATTLREAREGRKAADAGSGENIHLAAAAVGRGEFDLLAVGRMHLKDPGYVTSLRN
ncbi:12-oxophytodienoate reductase [Dietzia sp. 179-F 9C3 NHS]|uniref:oxidoreductase n=1 Tax=Dietzia sp. 179-F 9C3 NHS TaxID=3374295 RepID=UPI003879D669